MAPRKKSSDTAAARDGEPAVLRDPRAIRALAHPVRMSLLELLWHTGRLTATQASEILDESPANCAFHLRTLAKYGFVEEAGGGRGRERPWRLAHTSITVGQGEDTPEYHAAVAELGDSLLPALMQRAMAAVTRRDLWPEGWRKDVLNQAVAVMYLTPDEAREISAEISALTARHSGRADHPELRPADAIPVEFLTFAYPLLHLLGVPAGPAAGEEASQP